MLSILFMLGIQSLTQLRKVQRKWNLVYLENEYFLCIAPAMEKNFEEVIYSLYTKVKLAYFLFNLGIFKKHSRSYGSQK